MPHADLVAALEALPGRSKPNGGRMLSCPVHGADKDPSLSMDRGTDDVILLSCMAGCLTEDIVTTLGFDMADLFPPENGAIVHHLRVRKQAGAGSHDFEARYTDGTVAGQHRRTDDGRGSKRIWWDPKGVEVKRLALWGSWELPDSGVVVASEGERSVLAIRSAGFASVGTYGTGALPSAEALAVLDDRDVVLWPDADEKGRQHMAIIADALKGVAASVRTVRMPADAPKGWDAADTDADTITALVAGAGEPTEIVSGPPGMMVADDPEASFPEPPHASAYGGLIGECVDFLLEGTDASPVGILASLVSFCGALMPARTYWHGTHPSSPFLALVGQSGDGRKGTAMFRVRDALGMALGMDVVNRTKFDGIASGEALVKTLLARTNETFGVATGVLFEEEYETFLVASGREGSSLDSRMRSAFDGKQLSLRKVAETVIVPEPYYLSGLVGIPPTDLQRISKKQGFTSGTMNRWLWLPVVRREVRVLSSEPVFPDELRKQLVDAHHDTFKSPMRLEPDPAADSLLSDYDDYLRANATGMAARLTRRSGVIALRMALVHASVERSETITRDHVLRAIALTDYARRGLTYCFGHAAGDADATHLLRMLRDTDSGELTQSDLKADFIREPIRRQNAIDELQTLGLAHVLKVRTRGRPATVLRLNPQKRDFGDFGALSDTEQNEKHRNSVPKPISRSTNLSERVPEGVPKGAESSDFQPLTVVISQPPGEWVHPCRDYDHHQSSHRRVPDGWTCNACWPEEET